MNLQDDVDEIDAGPTISKEEFCRRFEDRVRLACRKGQSPFGMTPEGYSARVAEIWWQKMQGEWSPERSVDEDSQFWPHGLVD